MFNLRRFAVLFALVSLSAMNFSLTAWECCEEPEPSCNRLYVGAFGGGIFSDSSKANQYGTAFFSELTSIGPLSVIAEGHLNKTSSGFGGAQVGYEWSKPLCSGWSLAPAGELEYFYFSNKKKGSLINQTVNGLPEHDFIDSFHMSSNVILANVVFALNNDCLLFGFSPYVGGGIGATRISLHNADSLQVEPFEAGINHFNSNPNDSTWAFAAQAKAGVRYNFCQRFHVFAEYRYLYVDASNYIFGATNYTTHVPTSAWNVKVKNANYNAFAIGVQFDL